MKMLDDVIDECKVYGTLYGDDDDFEGYEMVKMGFVSDALYFLKELRYILDNLVWVEPEEKGHWEIRSLLPENDERAEK